MALILIEQEADNISIKNLTKRTFNEMFTQNILKLVIL